MPFALLCFLCGMVSLLLFLPTWQMRVVYLGLAHFISGFLHVQITISHFGMPVNEHADDPNASYNFIRTQFEHSLDVDCPWWMDWFHGGLQFQVVHHLLPRLPRHNLRYVRDTYIIPFANKYNIQYHHTDFIEANKLVVGRLRQTALKAREIPNDQLASWASFFGFERKKKNACYGFSSSNLTVGHIGSTIPRRLSEDDKQ